MVCAQRYIIFIHLLFSHVLQAHMDADWRAGVVHGFKAASSVLCLGFYTNPHSERAQSPT